MAGHMTGCQLWERKFISQQEEQTVYVTNRQKERVNVSFELFPRKMRSSCSIKASLGAINEEIFYGTFILNPFIRETSSTMCLKFLLFCVSCKTSNEIPAYQGEEGALLVKDYLCGRRECLRFQEHVYNRASTNPLCFGSESACGGPLCFTSSCRIEKVLYDCTKTPPFILRKYTSWM